MKQKQPKFRGYSLKTKKWHYGFGWYEVDYTEEYKKEKKMTDKACLYTEYGPIEVELDSVGQFIGLLDKKDTEIYEKDILEITNGSTDEYKRFIAEIHRHDASFNLVKPIYVNSVIAEPVPYYVINTGTVLGNSYEHKNDITGWKERIEIENEKRLSHN